MQGTINRMSQSKTAPSAVTILASLGFCLLFARRSGQWVCPGYPTRSSRSSPPAPARPPTAPPLPTLNKISTTPPDKTAHSPLRTPSTAASSPAKATGTVLDLSLDDAIQRGLRQNLGLILQNSSVKNANGQRLEELQSLLPTVNATASIEVQQINLAAFGLTFPGVQPRSSAPSRLSTSAPISPRTSSTSPRSRTTSPRSITSKVPNLPPKTHATSLSSP